MNPTSVLYDSVEFILHNGNTQKPLRFINFVDKQSRIGTLRDAIRVNKNENSPCKSIYILGFNTFNNSYK